MPRKPKPFAQGSPCVGCPKNKLSCCHKDVGERENTCRTWRVWFVNEWKHVTKKVREKAAECSSLFTDQ